MNTEINYQPANTIDTSDPPQKQVSPTALIELAINKDLDIEKLSQLMQMNKEWQAQKNREAFFKSLANFQSILPDIRKSKTVNFDSKTGGKVAYSYAPLGDIVRQIRNSIKSVGLTYRWEIQDASQEIKVTCIITHENGHSESTSMSAAADATGLKNPIQARASTIQYLQRYTLVGALGLSTVDSDVDGRLPEYDLDRLHKQYIELYNRLIQIDHSASKWHPDNWKSERNGPTYVKAISEITKELANRIKS